MGLSLGIGLLLSAPRSSADEAPAEAAAIVVRGEGREPSTSGWAGSRVERRDLDERLPRSAPDALRFEPGVFVQQTAHGQGSAFVRGRTGQQTVLLFDGIRLSNSTYRQGPNQYFFTVDARTVQSIEVLRGGASTLFGSDAIGGVIDARPVEPSPGEQGSPPLRPRASARYASADGSFGQRMQLEASPTDRLDVVAGAGYQRVGELRSGGAVLSPETGERPQVPSFEPDGKTQRGTGYHELTFDARATYRLSPGRRLVAAAYAYRQYDAPRTDQCPPAFAPADECLKIDEQFRTLVYAALEGDLGPLARSSKIALSYQRSHEKRSRVRPSSAILDTGRDDVDTLGLTAKLSSADVPLSPGASVRLDWGADAYADRVSSAAFLSFTDVGYTRALSRGQYLGGSRYAQGGAFAQAEARLPAGLVARAGGRAGAALAHAPSDPESGSVAVDRAYGLHAARAGLEWRALPWLSLLADVDRSVRAPNLDDLTSRQQTGPGFQLENARLSPELGTTLEAGARVSAPRLEVEAWAYRALLQDGITRLPRSAEACPPETPSCQSSWYRFQLVNASGLSVLHGLELYAKARLPGRVSLRATVAWAKGEGPTPGAALSRLSPGAEPRQPLSRVPPLNGTAEARVGLGGGAYVGAAVRWAALADRLSLSDRSDARIPQGGTPGFLVWDARAGYRVGRELVASIVVENLADAPYRYHGSSVNGPGRGAIVQLEAGL